MEKTCPLTYPCDVKMQRDTNDLPTAYCVAETPSLVDLDRLVKIYSDAQKGEPEGLDAEVRVDLAIQHLLCRQEQQAVLAEGTAIPVYAQTDSGELALDDDDRPIVVRMIQNPRSFALAEHQRQLGINVDDQLLSPKAAKRTPATSVKSILETMARGMDVLRSKKSGKG